MNARIRPSRPVARSAFALLACAPLALLLAGGSTAPGLPRAADAKYIGAGKCKSCHSNAETGDQYGKWTAAKHSKAFETLGGEEAKKVAAEAGIADPQKADACLSCHVTGFGEAETMFKKGFDMEQGVQCESCHGPGEAHMKARFMAAAKGDAAGPVEIPEGEIISRPTEETCRACHNEKSPSYKPFCFHEYSAQVRHLNPTKARDAIDIGTCSCDKCKDGCPDSCKETAQLK